MPGIRVIYKWLVEVGKSVSYYNDKALIKKDAPPPVMTARDSGEKKGIVSEYHKEVARLQSMVKERDKTIEDLREENEVLLGSNTKMKGELKQFQDQFLTLMKLLEGILDDETLAVPLQISSEHFKF